MTIQLERQSGHVMARASAVFARDDARAVCELLARDGRTRVTLDLQATRGSEPTAFAVLADALLERPARIHVVGLSWEQRRLLAYLGVREAPTPPPRDAAGDER